MNLFYTCYFEYHKQHNQKQRKNLEENLYLHKIPFS